MIEWWIYFKNLPTSVKIKYVIALPIGLLLYGICYVGEAAEKLDSIIGNWVRRGE